MTKQIILPAEDWQALALKAAEFGCLPSGGRAPNRPSIVTMLRHIARGKLRIVYGSAQEQSL